MKRADRISGIFWLAFGVIVAVESYRLGLGALRQPGPGFVFFWASIIFIFMSLSVFIQGCSKEKTEESEKRIFGKQNNRKIIFVLISVILYASLMRTLGFILATPLLFLFLMRVIEKKTWMFSVFVSILVTVVSYLVFEIWLMAQLPRGIILDSLRYLR